ncbi:hypothetical protein AMELA_G00035250 [Ameiurus melas]|uniref:Uncharacterized protein n=1 Tax=Ameiurus melas TaxID=219545 RepID=A0A7J6B8B9_AMEME|nr:hypothetical protein AMELA_G00035250 [Ameiurus melas]
MSIQLGPALLSSLLPNLTPRSVCLWSLDPQPPPLPSPATLHIILRCSHQPSSVPPASAIQQHVPCQQHAYSILEESRLVLVKTVVITG